MSRGGHIMGSKPERDPLEEIKQAQFWVTQSTELRWIDRSIRPPWAKVFLTTAMIIVGTFWMPWLTITITVLASVILFLFLNLFSVTRTLKEWTRVPEPDLSLEEDEKKKYVCSRGTGGEQHIVGMSLKSASSDLGGDLGKLIRGVDTGYGLSITVAMSLQNPKNVLEGDILPEALQIYLEHMSSNELKGYMLHRGGLWKASTSVYGHSRDRLALPRFEASIKGAIPEPGWKRDKTKDILERITTLQLTRNGAFHASGDELTEWLVQLKSELGPEVGSNVPGEFIAPIRDRPGDYRLGVTINPETLQTGPMAGMCHNDLFGGMLLCGGDWPERRRVMMLLTKQLLDAGKRVMIVSSKPEAIEFAALTDSGIGLTLGNDLVLNPVDAEDIPRSLYVPQLKMALETIADTDLSSAADFELALGRAVALSNATLADVTLPSADADMMDGTEGPTMDRPSRKTEAGMEAVKVLYQGSGSRAFYGHQTVKLSKLAEQQLSVTVISLGSVILDTFGWDLFSMKLASLRSDSDLVVILDGPFNLKLYGPYDSRYKRRVPWTDQLTRDLIRRGPLIVSIERPSGLATEVVARLSSCISLRLRDNWDIGVATDILGLTVIGHGLHSKARQSSRESSYLRVMEKGIALMVHDGAETCQPIQLDDAPALLLPSTDELSNRAAGVSNGIINDDGNASHKTLIGHVAGSKTDLAVSVLRLLQRYEPLTEEALRRFIISSSGREDVDVEAVLVRLEHASMILRGHESHGGVSYANYRLTMKGTMALHQMVEEQGGATATG
jgi:hypothetical protein